jgi:hypothetical protein
VFQGNTNTFPKWFWKSSIGKTIDTRFTKIPTTPDYAVIHKEVKHTHAAVQRRFGGHCAFCGDLFLPGSLTIDHLVPRSRGGGRKWSNLYPACRACNSAKADSLVNEFRAAIVSRRRASHCGHFQCGKHWNRLIEIFDSGPVVFWFETHKEGC